MANSKYEGGSKITTFRLPVKWFEEAKKTIDNYLKRFEGKPGLDRKIGYPVTPQQAHSAESRIDEAVQNYAENLRPAKKVVPKDLVEKLKELDPKIVVPEHKKITIDGDVWPGITNPKEKLHIDSEISELVKQGENGFFEWSCGCTAKNNLFRRSNNCKLPILKHLK